jgi:hypothetical protein
LANFLWLRAALCWFSLGRSALLREGLRRKEGAFLGAYRRHKCPFDSFAAHSCSGQALLHPVLSGSLEVGGSILGDFLLDTKANKMVKLEIRSTAEK